MFYLEFKIGIFPLWAVLFILCFSVLVLMFVRLHLSFYFRHLSLSPLHSPWAHSLISRCCPPTFLSIPFHSILLCLSHTLTPSRLSLPWLIKFQSISVFATIALNKSMFSGQFSMDSVVYPCACTYITWMIFSFFVHQRALVHKCLQGAIKCSTQLTHLNAHWDAQTSTLTYLHSSISLYK